jgi:hypothetical protein
MRNGNAWCALTSYVTRRCWVAVCARCKAVMRTSRLHSIEPPHAPITTRREYWLPTTRVAGHEVSSRGRVRSTLSGKRRILKTGLDAAGYPYVGPWTGTGNIRVRVHTLVLEAWCGTAPSKRYQARHYDDRKTHNMIRNLAWGTRSDNARDAVRNRRHNNARKRECHNGHAFTPENTRITQNGGRDCRACHRDRERERRSRSATDPNGTHNGRYRPDAGPNGTHRNKSRAEAVGQSDRTVHIARRQR